MSDEPTVQPEPQSIPDAPAAPASSPQPASSPAAAAESALRNAARRYGATDDALAQFESDDALADYLFDVAQEHAQVSPYAEIGQQMAPYLDQWEAFQQWQAEQQAAGQPDGQPADAGGAEASAFDWPTQEYDPAWETVNPTDDPMGYAQAQAKLREYRKWEQDAQRRLLREYPDLTRKAVEPVLAQQRQELEGRLAALEQNLYERDRYAEQQADQQWERAWLAQNARDFYVHDENGQPVVQNGNMVPNDYLNRVWQMYDWARSLVGQDGRPLPVDQAAAIAMNQVPRPASARTARTPEAAPRFIDTVSAEELRPAERQPGADGTAPASMYQNPEAIVDAAFRAAAAEKGVTLND